jgi:hypothetical protein
MPFEFEMVDVDGERAGIFATSEPGWKPGDRGQLRPGERPLIRQMWAPARSGFAGRWRVEPVFSGH